MQKKQPTTSSIQANDSSVVTPEEYEKNVTDFKKIDIEAVRQSFTEDQLEHTILFW